MRAERLFRIMRRTRAKGRKRGRKKEGWVKTRYARYLYENLPGKPVSV